jgi:arylsulfatase A-like enzyme
MSGASGVWRRVAIVACSVLAFATTLSIAAGPVEVQASAAVSDRPNILLLVSDDQAWSDFSRDLMPSVFGDLVDEGMLFKRAYVNTPLCCPSRAQMLTGLYEHHTGVDANAVPLERPTIVQALHDSGYRTMLAGKYLNSWESCGPRPEFDGWDCVGAPAPADYSMVNPWINEDGAWQQLQGYQTDILADRVVDFVKTTPAEQPFFAIYAPTTPHMPADDPRYNGMPVTPPRGASFDQDTLTTTSPLYARRGPLTPEAIASSDLRFTRMSHSVRALDDAVGHILDGLGDRARDTLVVYLSDNGFLFGEHRRFGKTDAYEESVRVPLVVRYPAMMPVEDTRTSQALVSNVDLTPTIAALAGIPWSADGRSLIPVLDGSAASVRSALLIEHCQGASSGSVPCSGISFFAQQTRAAAFEGVVTPRYKYVRYDDGERELFDLSGDPEELINLIGTPGSAPTVAALKAKLAALTAPAIDTTIVTGPWPAGAEPTRLAAFTFFSPSRFSTYRCRLIRDGVADPWHNCNGQSDAIGGLPDGDYTFEVTGIDPTGRVDPSPADRSFTVTSNGPAVSLVSHPPPAQTGGDAAFSFSSPLAGATFECRLSTLSEPAPSEPAPGWSGCGATNGATYAALADGAWNFEVRALDPATQTKSQPPASWLLRVDTTGPGFVLAQGPRSSTSSREADLRFVPTEGVSGTTSCRMDGGRALDCSAGRFSVSGLAKGVHTLRVAAHDALGNEGETFFTWTVDVGAPKARLARYPDPFTTSTIATFRLWSRTDPALFLCTLDGMALMPCDDENVFGPLAEGRHSLVMWGLDAAMNRSHALTYRWAVDTIPPGLILTGTPEEGAVTADRTASFEVWQSEPGSLSCSLDGAEFASCTSPMLSLELSDGPHTFQVMANDRAGNTSIVVSRSWTVDPNASTTP